MSRSKIDKLLKKAQEFEQLTKSLAPSAQPPPFMDEPTDEQPDEQILYRAQPKGKSLTGHTSGLAHEKVNGIFAFEDPEMLFQTYSWSHMKKRLDEYEMITFLGKIVDRPADSEGVVVIPGRIISKVPLRQFAKQTGAILDNAASTKVTQSSKRRVDS